MSDAPEHRGVEEEGRGPGRRGRRMLGWAGGRDAPECRGRGGGPRPGGAEGGARLGKAPQGAGDIAPRTLFLLVRSRLEKSGLTWLSPFSVFYFRLQ